MYGAQIITLSHNRNTVQCWIEAMWQLFRSCLLFGSCHFYKYEPCLLFGSIELYNEPWVLFGLCYVLCEPCVDKIPHWAWLYVLKSRALSTIWIVWNQFKSHEYYLDCAKITNQSHEYYSECAFSQTIAVRTIWNTRSIQHWSVRINYVPMVFKILNHREKFFKTL